MLVDDEKRVMEIVKCLRQPGKSTESVKDVYQHWAEYYDKDLLKVNYEAPGIAAIMLASLYTSCDRGAVTVLDLAAGTGLVGEHLQKHGFTNIDATDLSEEMLKIAAEKKVYTGLILAEFGVDSSVIAADTYDALVGVGCFTQDHLNHSCFPEIRRVVKPGKDHTYEICE